MAAAAESGLLWQGAQFWLSLFSAVGLGISILYAARAASASSEAAQASIQSLRLSQRGFVAVKTFLIHRSTWALSTGETVQGVSVVPVIGNMGSAPALITSIVWSTRTKMHGDQSPFEFPQDPSDQKLKILVGPGVEITDRAREVNLLTLRKIYSQEIRVVFSFRHDYADLFDASKSYHSFSCFELKVVADPDVVYGSELIEPSRFIHLEARGEFGSAS